jgi:class 3 adenylate cyclase
MPSVRRLTAILADVAGYSRLMGADEEGTHERLKAHLGQPLIRRLRRAGGELLRKPATACWRDFRASFERSAQRNGRDAPTRRDRQLQLIAERGRRGWQRASGYNWRALVEADIGRYKRVIGDTLRSRAKRRQTTEVAIAVASLNRMLGAGAAGVRSPPLNLNSGGAGLTSPSC